MGSLDGNILIVEDEMAHAELIERAIRKVNSAHRVDIVSNGEAALDYFFNRGEYTDGEQYPLPTLVLLDIKLPGIDGLDVLKQIKEHPKLRVIPVVILTTSSRREDMERAYHSHANSYLTKPVSFKAFEEKIQELNRYWMNLNEQPCLH